MVLWGTNAVTLFPQSEDGREDRSGKVLYRVSWLLTAWLAHDTTPPASECHTHRKNAWSERLFPDGDPLPLTGDLVIPTEWQEGFHLGRDSDSQLHGH